MSRRRKLIGCLLVLVLVPLLGQACPPQVIPDPVPPMVGPQGPKGDQGDPGPQGPKGDIGLQGTQGDTGDTGAQGLSGNDGQDGTDGQDGLACWDLNGNGVGDLGEDVNGDGSFDALDCKGEKGDKGDPGDDATVSAGNGITVNSGVVSLDTNFHDLYWRLGGNAGTAAGTNFVGTTDNQPMELRANGARALRIEPNATSPNLIGGFSGNNITGGVIGATIGGGGANGVENSVTHDYGTVSGGKNNSAAWIAATIAGGENNTASNGDATVGGGEENLASGGASTIAGGFKNTASGSQATVCGGENNTASGTNSCVAGGADNTAAGSFSFAAGDGAVAMHGGAWVWASGEGSDVTSTAVDQFTARAAGGFRFFTNSTMTAGATLNSGSGTWSSLSDRNAKQNFKPVNSNDVLDRLVAIPLETWNYKSQHPSIRHIGPMAQDFYRAFGVGEDDRHITTIDADGVALAAIQGLYMVVKDKEQRIASQQEQIDRLGARMKALEALIKQR